MKTIKQQLEEKNIWKTPEARGGYTIGSSDACGLIRERLSDIVIDASLRQIEIDIQELIKELKEK